MLDHASSVVLTQHQQRDPDGGPHHLLLLDVFSAETELGVRSENNSHLLWDNDLQSEPKCLRIYRIQGARYCDIKCFSDCAL